MLRGWPLEWVFQRAAPWLSRECLRDLWRLAEMLGARGYRRITRGTILAIMTDQRLAFGSFVLDPARGSLMCDGKSVSVGQRGLTLLQALLEAGGEVVPKAELMERAWPGTYVEEGNLTVQIAALRKCLGDAPGGQPWIATVPRVGYRLLAWRARAKDAAALPGLAVLPFESLGAGEDGFADGVVAEIITALTRFATFAVVSRTSSSAYRARAVDTRTVAAELGVSYVLQGSVRQGGERVRINAQLVDGASGAHLWAERFDGPRAEVLDVQDRIAASVAAVVEPRIRRAEVERSLRERPESVAAYDLNVKALGKVLRESPEDNAEGYALLIDALVVDPENPQLLAHAAFALEHRIVMGWPQIGPDDARACVELARRGLNHAAGDAAVMAHCGIALLQPGKDYESGMAALEAALAANPNDLIAVTLAGIGHLHCGRVATALELFHQANAANPGHPFAHGFLCGIAHVHMIRGTYEEALVWAARSRAVSSNFACAYWMLVAGNAHLGRMVEARHFLNELTKLVPGLTIAKVQTGQPAKDPSRIAAILEGLRLAGLDEG